MVSMLPPSRVNNHTAYTPTPTNKTMMGSSPRKMRLFIDVYAKYLTKRRSRTYLAWKSHDDDISFAHSLLWRATLRRGRCTLSLASFRGAAGAAPSSD